MRRKRKMSTLNQNPKTLWLIQRVNKSNKLAMSILNRIRSRALEFSGHRKLSINSWISYIWRIILISIINSSKLQSLPQKLLKKWRKTIMIRHKEWIIVKKLAIRMTLLRKDCLNKPYMNLNSVSLHLAWSTTTLKT